MTEPVFRDPDPMPEALPDDDLGDFAEEHTSNTFADEVRGGLEGAPEPESPRGLAGMDD
jgi:hypothetical protein